GVTTGLGWQYDGAALEIGHVNFHGLGLIVFGPFLVVLLVIFLVVFLFLLILRSFVILFFVRLLVFALFLVAGLLLIVLFIFAGFFVIARRQRGWHLAAQRYGHKVSAVDVDPGVVEIAVSRLEGAVAPVIEVFAVRIKDRQIIVVVARSDL